MTINQLFAAMCGFYTDTRVAVYTDENDSHFFYHEEDHAAIVNGIITLQSLGYGSKVVKNFRIHEINDHGTHIGYLSILIAKEDTSC